MQLTSRPPGYILIETMFASALIAIGLGTTIDLIAAARRNVTTASNRQTAASLAADKCAEIAMFLPGVTPDQTALVAISTTTLPGFSWTWQTDNLTDSVAKHSTPAITREMREIICTVQYPTEKGSFADRTGSALTTDELGQYVLKRIWTDLR